MSQVQVPGGRKVNKKALLIGGGAVAVIVGIAYYRKRRNASAASAPTVDTTTGALNADGTYQNPAPVRSVDNTIDTSGGAAIVTNAQWTQAAIAQMPNWDPQYLQIAFGAFLADQPLDANQANAVRAAEGLVGPPPIGNHVIVMSTAGAAPGTEGTPANPVPGPPPGQVRSTGVGVNMYEWAAANVSPHTEDRGAALNTLRGYNPNVDLSTSKNLNWVSGVGQKQPITKVNLNLRVS
jgi:hypothetical protein